MHTPLLEIKQLLFHWPKQAPLLAIQELQLQRGEKLFLKGPSGSGKTTLLSLISGVHVPTSGTVALLDQDIHALSQSARDYFRVTHIGYLFQQFNLLPFLSVQENVVLPCRFSKVRRQKAIQGHGSPANAAKFLLKKLGMNSNLLKRPAAHLSIGQQQRVAAARALIGAPELIIADEPTSALDADNRTHFLELLFDQCSASGASLLFVSHDQTLAEHFDRNLCLNTLNQIQPSTE